MWNEKNQFRYKNDYLIIYSMFFVIFLIINLFEALILYDFPYILMSDKFSFILIFNFLFILVCLVFHNFIFRKFSEFKILKIHKTFSYLPSKIFQQKSWRIEYLSFLLYFILFFLFIVFIIFLKFQLTFVLNLLFFNGINLFIILLFLFIFIFIFTTFFILWLQEYFLLVKKYKFNIFNFQICIKHKKKVIKLIINFVSLFFIQSFILFLLFLIIFIFNFSFTNFIKYNYDNYLKKNNIISSELKKISKKIKLIDESWKKMTWTYLFNYNSNYVIIKNNYVKIIPENKIKEKINLINNN